MCWRTWSVQKSPTQNHQSVKSTPRTSLCQTLSQIHATILKGDSVEKTVVSGTHSVSSGAKHNTGSGSHHQHTEKEVFNKVPLTDDAFNKMEETSDLLTQIDGAQFVLLEDHYVKLGETSAYIIVMQKQISEII